MTPMRREGSTPVWLAAAVALALLCPARAAWGTTCITHMRMSVLPPAGAVDVSPQTAIVFLASGWSAAEEEANTTYTLYAEGTMQPVPLAIEHIESLVRIVPERRLSPETWYRLEAHRDKAALPVIVTRFRTGKPRPLPAPAGAPRIAAVQARAEIVSHLAPGRQRSRELRVAVEIDGLAELPDADGGLFHWELLRQEAERWVPIHGQVIRQYLPLEQVFEPMRTLVVGRGVCDRDAFVLPPGRHQVKVALVRVDGKRWVSPGREVKVPGGVESLDQPLVMPEPAGACADPQHARSAVSSAVNRAGARQGFRPVVRDAACNDQRCRMRFSLIPTDGDCAWPLPSAANATPALTPLGDGDFACTFPQTACETLAASPKAVNDRESPILAQCIRPAQAMAARVATCRAHEAYGLPPPPPSASSRRGVDMAVAWQSGNASLEQLGLALALTRDYRLSEAVLGGARVGYLGIPGSALAAGGDGAAAPRAGNFHALELGVRARLRFDALPHGIRPELEAHVGYRLALAANDHAAGGLGLYLAWRKLGMGLRYARAFEDAAPVHTLLLVSERHSLIGDTRGGHGKHPRVGLGLHAIAAGWGFAEGLGYMLPGVALELPVDFGVAPLVAVARWDFLWFPGIGAEALTAQTVLGGVQWWKLGHLPLGVSAMAGYGMTQGDAPRAVEAGPIADVGTWYWLDDLGWHLGLHSRLGLATANQDLRALYLSIGGRQIF